MSDKKALIINPSLDITFSPEQFSSKIVDTTKVDHDYDIILNDDYTFELREESKGWVVVAPLEISAQME